MTPDRENRHGVAVAVGDIGLLILGDSGAGKSALAARLLADGGLGATRLVADDRVLLERCHGRILARPHPAIAGALELRGLAIVRPVALDAVVLRGILRLSDQPPDRLPDARTQTEQLLGVALPRAVLPPGGIAFGRLITIWPYFRGQIGNVRSILELRP